MCKWYAKDYMLKHSRSYNCLDIILAKIFRYIPLFLKNNWHQNSGYENACAVLKLDPWSRYRVEGTLDLWQPVGEGVFNTLSAASETCGDEYIIYRGMHYYFEQPLKVFLKLN